MTTVAPVAAAPVAGTPVVKRTRRKKTVEEAPRAPELPKPEEVIAAPEPVKTDPISANEELILEETPVLKDEDQPPIIEDEEATKKKKTVSKAKDKLFRDFEQLSETLDKILGEQNLKNVQKDLKNVRELTYKLLKLRVVEKQKRDNNNSGFMKPIRVSVELEGFLKKNNLFRPELTRAYLTTVLCSYIKANNLQNPDDRRIIFPDADLNSLFNGSTNDNEPLTYYTLQKKIQCHIFKA